MTGHEKFPALRIEALVARHVAALQRQQQQEQNRSTPGDAHHSADPSAEGARSATSGSSPRRSVVDLQYVIRPTASHYARVSAINQERADLAKSKSGSGDATPRCGSANGSDGPRPAIFDKLFSAVKVIPEPPPVSRIAAEPARRKDFAQRHQGKTIAAVIAPEAASKHFHDDDISHRKQVVQQHETSTVEEIKKFRGPRLSTASQEALVLRLADDSIERQRMSKDELRRQYFAKYAAINVTPSRRPTTRSGDSSSAKKAKSVQNSDVKPTSGKEGSQ